MNQQKRNYQKELEAYLAEQEQKAYIPKLLLHSCCAPCSSYVLMYLSRYFHITVLYYNPNIFPEEEYQKRVEEQKRLIEQMPAVNPIQFLAGEYHPQTYFQAVKGYEHEPEGGARCEICFRMRLSYAAKLAKEGGYDCFTTTLTISPLKNAELLNTLGEEIGREEGIAFLNSDFKKKGGYQQSIQLSKEYDLYRQDYCGCIYSKEERLMRSRE